MRFLFIVGRELSYQRNDVLLRAFQRLGQVDVIASRSKPNSLVINSLILSLRSFRSLLFGQYDLVFIGFYGHLIILLIGILARRRKIPIVFDVFVSNYDTLVNDRKVFVDKSLRAKLAIWLDRSSCSLADHILLDTQQHVAYFCQTFGILPERISSIPVGCNEDIFYFQQVDVQEKGKSNVLFYCTYQPLHGVHIVIEAANLLKAEDITFHLIGTGQEYSKVRTMARNYQLKNIRFSPSVPLPLLRDELSRADVCLGGHFGNSEKAKRVVPGKIYQILAVGRPVIAAKTPANLSLLVDGESSILIQPNDPVALADAICVLHAKPSLRKVLVQGGTRVYQSCCSESIITKKLEEILSRLI